MLAVPTLDTRASFCHIKAYVGKFNLSELTAANVLPDALYQASPPQNPLPLGSDLTKLQSLGASGGDISAAEREKAATEASSRMEHVLSHGLAEYQSSLRASPVHTAARQEAQSEWDGAAGKVRPWSESVSVSEAQPWVPACIGWNCSLISKPWAACTALN